MKDLIKEPEHPDGTAIEDGESLSSFYARSTRKHAVEARRIINSVAGIDVGVRRILLSRLTSTNDREFIAAFSEIVAFCLFSGLGHEVGFVSEESSKFGLTPDLLVRPSHGQDFFAEVVSVWDPAESIPARDARLVDLRKAIESVDTPRYYYAAFVDGAPVRSPSRSAISGKIERWAKGFDYESMLAKTDADNHAPELTLMIDEGCSISLVAYAIKLENLDLHFNKTGAGFLVDPIEFHTQVAIRKALKDKLKRYNKLGEPFVVVVNLVSAFVKHSEFLEALFGDMVYFASPRSCISKQGNRPCLLPNGCWRSEAGPRYRNCAGIVAIHNLQPQTVENCEAYFINNPWTSIDLNDRFMPLPLWRITDAQSGKLGTKWIDGMGVAGVLELDMGQGRRCC